MGYVAWELSPIERAKLLEQFPPRYPDVVAHHITHVFGVRPDAPLPEGTTGMVIGVADNDAGVQALVIDMGHPRPDGEVYHCTWSLDRAAGCAPKHSKEVCSAGWVPVTPVPLTDLRAAYFR